MTRLKQVVKRELRRQPVHPFPARMAPGLALNAVSGAHRRLRVLDPMMGSGTVLVAARERGHRAIGVDLDPLAVMISKVWTTAVDKRKVRLKARAVLTRAAASVEAILGSAAYPKGATRETKEFIRYWFDLNVRRELAALTKAIGSCRDENVRNVLWCGFSRLIIAKQAGVSLALDLAHSRPHRFFKKGPSSPLANFMKAVDHVLKNCLSTKEKRRGPAARAKVGDARSLPLADGTIDLVLTSPPYINAIDYLRCSKFSLVWMGHSIGDLRNLRSNCIGTEVGEYKSPSGSVSRKLIGRLKLASRLSARETAVISRFITDMHSAIKEVSRVLVPGGRAIYVIGENTIRGTYIRNATIFIALAKTVGLSLEANTNRTLPPNRRYLPPPSRKKGKAALDTRMRREVVLQFVKAASP